MSFPDEATEQARLLARCCERVIPDLRSLRDRIASSIRCGHSLWFKTGFDPTADALHLGHFVILRVVRRCIELGHEVVLILGTGTGTIGDPSGRNRARPVLSRTEASKNAHELYQDLALALPMDKVRVIENAVWLDNMTFMEALDLLGRVRVSEILERRALRARIKSGEGVRLNELLYPIVQGYESVFLGSSNRENGIDVEIGAIDQLYNVQMGRSLQKSFGQAPQICLLLPLLLGTDGKKMSKSARNCIPLRTDPRTMFAQLMDLPNARAVRNYFSLLTDMDDEEADASIAVDLQHARLALARTVVEQIRGAGAASSASAWYTRVYMNNTLPSPDELNGIPVETSRACCLRALLVDHGIAHSARQVTALIAAQQVRVNGKPVTRARWFLHDQEILQIGHVWRRVDADR